MRDALLLFEGMCGSWTSIILIEKNDGEVFLRFDLISDYEFLKRVWTRLGYDHTEI